MEEYRTPAFNFFTSSRLKRSAEKRLDKEWIRNRIKDDNTKIVVASDLKFLLSEKPDLHAIYIPADEFPLNTINIERFIFLGEKEGTGYFCLDITGYPEIIDSALSRGKFKELRTVAAYIDKEDAAILAYARALVFWHKNHLYCGVCGGRTISAEAGHKLLCGNPECGTEHFPRTDPAVIMLVVKDGKCLLAHQAKWAKGRYSTIAGFVEPGESLEQAVQREVFEETGIIVKNIKYHSSQPWPFPASIMLGFRATAVTSEIKLIDNELEDAEWLSRKEITDGIEKGVLGFPPPISVSFKLIQDWFDEESSIHLEELIRRNG